MPNTDQIIEISIEEGAVAGQGFGPGINRPVHRAVGAGGASIGLLAAMLFATRKKRRRSSKLQFSWDQKQFLKFLKSLDALKMLHLARAEDGIFTSA